MNPEPSLQIGSLIAFYLQKITIKLLKVVNNVNQLMNVNLITGGEIIFYVLFSSMQDLQSLHTKLTFVFRTHHILSNVSRDKNNSNVSLIFNL